MYGPWFIGVNCAMAGMVASIFDPSMFGFLLSSVGFFGLIFAERSL
jgi:hypothetical protein